MGASVPPENPLNNLGQNMAARQAEAAIADRASMASRFESAYRIGSDVFGQTNRLLVNPMTAGSGLGFNPFNLPQLFAANISTYFNYNNLFAQSRAFLGGNSGVTEQSMNAEGFVSGLKAIGSSRSEALRAMQEIAAAARQVSNDMVGASESVLRFARATGTDAGQMARAAGSAMTTSNLAPTAANLNNVLENVRVLASGVSARVAPIAGGIQAFREMQIQAGTAVTFDDRGVDNATRLMAGFIGLDARLYQNRPDVAARHFGQMQGMANGPLLGLAMDAARSLGMSTDIVDVQAAIQSGDQRLLGALAARVGSSRGLQAMLSMMGVDAPFLQKLRADPNAIREGNINQTARSSLSVNRAMAEGATTASQRALANINVQMEAGTPFGIAESVIDMGSDVPLGFVYGIAAAKEGVGLAGQMLGGRVAMGRAAAGRAAGAAARGSSTGMAVGMGAIGGAAIGQNGRPVVIGPNGEVMEAPLPPYPGLTEDSLRQSMRRVAVQDSAAYSRLTPELQRRLGMVQFSLQQDYPGAVLQFRGLRRPYGSDGPNDGSRLTMPDGRVLELGLEGGDIANIMRVSRMKEAVARTNAYSLPTDSTAAPSTAPGTSMAAPAGETATAPVVAGRADGGLPSASAQLVQFTRQLSAATVAAERFASQVNAAAGAAGSPRGGSGTR